jgi:hypothetical protein
MSNNPQAVTEDGKTVSLHPLAERHTEQSVYSYYIRGFVELVKYVAGISHNWQPSTEYDSSGKNVFTVELPAETVKSGKIGYKPSTDKNQQTYLLMPIRSREGSNEIPRITGPYLFTDQTIVKPDSVAAKAVIWSEEMAKTNQPSENPTNFQITGVQGSPIVNEAPELTTVLNNAFHMEGDGKGGTNYENLSIENISQFQKQLGNHSNNYEALNQIVDSLGIGSGEKDAIKFMVNNHQRIRALADFFVTLGTSWEQLQSYALLADPNDFARIQQILENTNFRIEENNS